MGWVGGWPRKNHKENFKKCHDFFSSHSSVKADSHSFTCLVFYLFCGHLQILPCIFFFLVFKKCCQALAKREG